MFLLDTNVVSELRKIRPHGALLAWYRAQGEYSIFVPSVALYELQAGVENTRKHDFFKAIEIEDWIDRIVATSVVLDLDTESARLAAKTSAWQAARALGRCDDCRHCGHPPAHRRDKKHQGFQKL